MAPVEQFFQCPYCWEQISMLLEPSYEVQEYIEDCEVCCQPIKVVFAGNEENEITSFNAINIEQ